jgi:drug/metabolite transporter (DMT)-like permease
MYKGIAFALSACFIWGMIFIIPQFMSSFSSLEIALGRYWFYGAISLLILLKANLQGSCRYPLAIWMKAFGLSLLSGYYLWVVLAIRFSSPEVCALILGTSPITIALYGNWKEKEISYKQLLIPCLLILVGLVMINAPRLMLSNSAVEYSLGLIFSVVSLISWSAYVVLNARFLKHTPSVQANDWATMQGVTTLIWVIVGGCACCFVLWDQVEMDKYLTLNDEMIQFLVGCAALGLLCSWVGASLWNKASVHLPVSLAGQLMIFETIFGIVFVCLLEQKLPPLIEWSGILLLLGSVTHSIRSLSKASSHKSDEQGNICLATVDPKVPNGKKLH